jgi:hypothetical protein
MYEAGMVKAQSITDIASQWKEHQRREVKSRIRMVEGKGTGYGSAMVPVLAGNDYDLESGEASVFDVRALGLGNGRLVPRVTQLALWCLFADGAEGPHSAGAVP